MAETLYDKLWREHHVCDLPDGRSLIYIDRHLIHEVTSAQAFAGLRKEGRHPWRQAANLAVLDHSIPTFVDRTHVVDQNAKRQIDALVSNCADEKIELFDMSDERQGIVHVIGPEQGSCLPGMTVVCGDSHTSTNGALGALAFGIGTSDVEHVLATQCLPMTRLKNMRVIFIGQLRAGVTAKDMILSLIHNIGVAGATGYAIEYAGQAVRSLSMEGRMTICNMSIEAGARAGLVEVDDTTLEYVQSRPRAPKGDLWEQAADAWRLYYSDDDAVFDRELVLPVDRIEPQVSWGTTPEMVSGITGRIPAPDEGTDEAGQKVRERALAYMDLEPGTLLTDIRLDKVFIGSCTNARLEDLREAASVVRGHKVAKGVHALVVPGSGLVKAQAEKEGLAKIFTDAGFEWRMPGCSMCLGMNPDQLAPHERCASTSNRNFEGRQGKDGRTHLVSPPMAAAAAITGHFVDVREFFKEELIPGV